MQMQEMTLMLLTILMKGTFDWGMNRPSEFRTQNAMEKSTSNWKAWADLS